MKLERLTRYMPGRKALLVLGGGYVLSGIALIYIELIQGTSPSNAILLSFFVIAPGFILLYGGYSLPNSGIHKQFYPIVTFWCLSSIAILSGFLTLYHFQPGQGMSEPIRAFLVITGFVVIPAFAGGLNDAREKTRSYELGERNHELQETHAELRETVGKLKRYEKTVETVWDGVTTLDADNRFVMVNEAFCEMTGYDREDIIGEHAELIIDDSAYEKAAELHGKVAEEDLDVAILEYNLMTADGRSVPVEVHFGPCKFGDSTVGETGVIRDVSNRKEYERELERAMELLARTEDIADVGGWEINPDTAEVFWTENIFDLLEWPYDEEPPLSKAIEVYHEDDRSIVMDAVTTAFEHGKPFDIEVRYFTTKSEMRWLRVQGIPEIDDGEVVTLRGAVQDITERKERERTLKRVNDRLVESNQRLEQFAYAASHDLQEPLRMVSSYLQLIERRYGDEFDEDGREFLDFAVDGANRMRAMIDGLLRYSRVESEGASFDRIDLNEMLDDVCDDLTMQISESNADITVSRMPIVFGDEHQLRQVFQNLITNAIQYSGEEHPEIYITGDKNGDRSTISVRDEGIGIDPADQERIFDIFRRVHTHDEIQGSGLGLALTERIIERHNGDIWVDSEPEQGTTISFTLPAEDGRNE